MTTLPLPADQMEYIIEFTQPTHLPPSENWLKRQAFAGRGGAMKAHRELSQWRDAAFYAWKEARLGPAGGALGQPCEVRIEIGFHQNRTRDPHNYVGTVCKSVIDGLVKAGLWPDDNPEWVTVVEPVLVIHERVPNTNLLQCRVVLTPRER